ncbi:hypothetical protein SAMN05216302_101121 [Nitrosomonas aestuarii]|uniref:Portal protein n=2 Tax=Nitrosomonas aestuarii TaxID=52441 RepID=A0A1I4B4P8_9PROT|nr:hypothetical protein SAMN05216302_101121 [Nitrosomonas aestuarii]
MANTKKSSFLSKFGMPTRRWESEYIKPVDDIKESDSYLYGAGHTTVASLLGTGRRAARDRQTIYCKWEDMESDAIVSSALKLLVTSALGGHETSGDVIFIEQKPETKKDKKLTKITEEVANEIAPILNREAFAVAYTGSTFGDSYARIYSRQGKGVIDLYTGELVRPQLVQPFERGNRNLGYHVYVGNRNHEKLDVSQIARLKMPRIQWVPQHGIVEKSLRIAIKEDEINNLRPMPSMAGGSLLYNAEESYNNLYASILGLVGQRWVDSINEQMLQVNLESMTLEQQKRFLKSIKDMLIASKKRAENAVNDGRPVLEKIMHIIPTFGEKQISTVSNANGGQTGRSGDITIEDVLLHARLLSGAIGVDLSMLGFADQMSGGLGEGGFFRTSAQAAENSRLIRGSLAEFCNQVIDIHTYKRYGFVFNPDERPWIINFYGSISALEAEKQRTRADAMNGGMMLAQAMQQMKDLGASEQVMIEFLTKTMMLDEEQAKLYASIVKAKEEENQNGDMESDKPGNGGRFKMDSASYHYLEYDEYEDATFDGIGSSTTIPIPNRTVKWLGFEGSMSLRADLHALAGKHSEIYDDNPDMVLEDIQFVVNKPDDWFIHNNNRISIFRERLGSGAIPLVRVEFEININGSSLAAVVRSVYASNKRQIAKKMQEKKKIMTRFGSGENRPELLTVAEYLSALGNRS